MQIYTEKDVDVSALEGARVAVLGYGSQGRAHALNLRDSGFDVVVGLRQGGKSWAKAEQDGMTLMAPSEAVKDADLICLLVPDIAQKPVYEAAEANIKPGAAVSFAHGFNIHFDQIHPKEGVDCILVAPKGPGDLVRRQFQEGRGVPCLIAVGQDASGKARDKALAYAHAIGGTRGGGAVFEAKSIKRLHAEMVAQSVPRRVAGEDPALVFIDHRADGSDGFDEA